MENNITSKERMLNAIEYKPVDYIPCSFMMFFNLTHKYRTQETAVAEQLKMGLDATVNVGTLKHSFHPDTKYDEWVDNNNGSKYFCRKLETPKGDLVQRVKQRNNWPSDENFPIFDDYIVPRAEEVFVKPEEDLEKLKYLLAPFSNKNIQTLKEEAKEAKKIADEHGLMQIAGEISRDLVVEGNYSLIAGEDIMAWLSGYENIMALSLLKPEIVEEYAQIISDWNISQLEIYIDVTDVDLIVRRAWYETTEFWTPEAYKNIIAPTLKREADLVHQAGKKYGYIITSAFLPIIDHIIDTGIDVLIGLDPEEGKGTELSIVKDKFADKKVALWGGVSGAVTIENGTEAETEKATLEALESLSKGGGFILSPVDNIREVTKNAWDNTHKFIDTWKNNRGKYIEV